MNEDIKIAEILKLCKPGIKLYSPAYGELYLDEVIDYGLAQKMPGHIQCKSKSGTERKFDLYGRISFKGEIMLFPEKGQRDWNLFSVPGGITPIYSAGQIIERKAVKYEVIKVSDTSITIKNLNTSGEVLDINIARQGEFNLYVSPIFKEGDIIVERESKDIFEVTNVTDWYYQLKRIRGYSDETIRISSQIKYTLVKFKSGDQIRCTRGGDGNNVYTVAELDEHGNYTIHSNCESFKLLLDLQDNYELVEDISLVQKFTIGDKIREISKPEHTEVIIGLFKSGYWLKKEEGVEKPDLLLFIEQDKYELSPFEKFDPKTLKPFDRVLVRIDDGCAWCVGIFSHIAFNGKPFISGYKTYSRCIPYEGNEHLLGTLNDCSDYYKI